MAHTRKHDARADVDAHRPPRWRAGPGVRAGQANWLSARLRAINAPLTIRDASIPIRGCSIGRTPPCYGGYGGSSPPLGAQHRVLARVAQWQRPPPQKRRGWGFESLLGYEEPLVDNSIVTMRRRVNHRLVNRSEAPSGPPGDDGGAGSSACCPALRTCRRGGTGRRASLRRWCPPRAWGFDSLRRHTASATNSTGAAAGCGVTAARALWERAVEVRLLLSRPSTPGPSTPGP
jgi:hypothetical protein